ncbi:hypothetical protein NLJ89_g4695 [Agrocybe chaxingu]|uniref:BTB domain-containing protein n=1 Tax=Agrocybe chaxingu TaxID=84603 RepID=A0A9W8MVQ1_9AGAR|nr:hypothetical protein NLJ89_g4695 [Agrocybe chaxingu]
MQQPDSGPQTTRSTDFWFEDGSVVLQATDMQFRVHKSVLARQSSVFADMFSISQDDSDGDSDSPLVDDCSVVVLQDSVEDVQNLLELLYNTMKCIIRSLRACNLRY